MAYKIIWATVAREDMRSIVSFIRLDDPDIAMRIGNRLIGRVEILARFPRFGRRVPELMEDTVREVIEPPYRVIYRVDDEARVVMIIRVWHGARGTPEFPADE